MSPLFVGGVELIGPASGAANGLVAFTSTGAPIGSPIGDSSGILAISDKELADRQIACGDTAHPFPLVQNAGQGLKRQYYLVRCSSNNGAIQSCFREALSEK